MSSPSSLSFSLPSCVSGFLRRLSIPLIAAASFTAAASAFAEYPDRPITIIVPFNTGTTPDIVTRLLADAVGRDIGQSIIVVNRVGASGIIGTQAVINSPADGYTLGFANVATLAINQSLYKKLPYDADKQLAPVVLTGSVQNVLAVRSELGVKNVQELIALAKSKPGVLTAGSGGNGTTGHLSAEMFKAMAGLDIVHVPYKGGLEADLALLRGEVDMVFENISSISPHLKNEKLRPLAVTGANRDPRLPNLPTMAESGLKDYQAVAWTGYVAPAATNPEILDFLNNAFNKAVKSEAVAKQLDTLAYQTKTESRSALFDLAHKERPIWATAIKHSGAKLD